MGSVVFCLWWRGLYVDYADAVGVASLCCCVGGVEGAGVVFLLGFFCCVFEWGKVSLLCVRGLCADFC